ncbi:hypothetical protein HF521_010651, partial [Silurus meridionalis]
MNMDDQYYILVNVYGFNNAIQNRQLTSDVSNGIRSLKLIYQTVIIIMGAQNKKLYYTGAETWAGIEDNQEDFTSVELDQAITESCSHCGHHQHPVQMDLIETLISGETPTLTPLTM